MTKESLFRDAAVVVVAIALGFFLLHFVNTNGRTPTFGAVGNLLAENYIPYVRVNGGYNSADPMTTSGLFTASGGTTLSGANTLSGATTFTSTALFSSTGTSVNRINFGTCYVQSAATTISATSTATVDCQASTTGANTALTGITAGDVVNVQFATTTPTTVEGLSILGASASSTAGYITMKVFNGTGATFTWTASASTTNYIVIH